MSTSNLNSDEVIALLQKQVDDDSEFVTLLTESLVAANNHATAYLDPVLYAALNALYDGNGWPLEQNAYISYLTTFAQVIPSENTGTYDPWRNTSGQNGYSQEIYDRLCHFYLLVDQGVGKRSLQYYTSSINDFKFATWLGQYADAWGSFLDTPESLTPETLASFEHDPEYNLPDYSADAPNWKSFNTFFYRQLNPTKTDGSPMRPVANPKGNQIVTSPADCTFKKYYQIDGAGNVMDHLGNKTKISLKLTHVIGNINELLGTAGAPYASAFYGGTFVHYFLSPFDYHRFHSPVSGKVSVLDAVPGNVYLKVRIVSGQFDAPDSSADGYEFNQARGVLIIDTSITDSNIGTVATLPIGMAQVSSVNMYSDQLQGQPISKGQEFGYFAFGGSDIIMLFEKPIGDLKFVTEMANTAIGGAADSAAVAPFHFRYGEPSVYFE